IGIARPGRVVVAERRWQVTGHAVYLELAKRWARGTAILFAVGAVSGTVLSFELGLLWPGFMDLAGAIIGMPFSLEGFAFFTEAIFLGVYLYGWERISSRAHLWAGVAVALSGAASGIFVVIANSWMNAPAGFELVNGRAAHRRPSAGEARGRGGGVPHAGRRAPDARRLAGCGGAGDPVRGRDPLRPVAARVPRSARRRQGTGCRPARGLAQRPGGALVLPADGRTGDVPRPGLPLGGMARVAPPRARAQPLAHAGHRARHADGLHRRGSGVDGHRAGPPAVGDLWRLEDGGRRHSHAGARRAVRHVHPAVLLPGRHRRLAPVSADPPESDGAGVAGVRHGILEAGGGGGAGAGGLGGGRGG